jgi:hypothetical protein
MTVTVQEIVDYIEQQLILVAYLDTISGRAPIRHGEEIAYKEILEFMKTGDANAAHKKAVLTAQEGGATNETNHIDIALEGRSEARRSSAGTRNAR